MAGGRSEEATKDGGKTGNWSRLSRVKCHCVGVGEMKAITVGPI